MAGTTGYPRHPERGLASALYAGLAALYRLADQMSNDYDPTAYQLFTGIKEMWQETRVQLQALDNDLTPVFNIEPNMRKNLLGMLWHLTKYYGNTEFKRVYRWTEGTIGPLNAMLNFAGAELRTVAMRLFPMPAPSYYQIREHPDGTIQKLHRSTAMRYPAGNKIKTQWIASYPGNSTHPDFRVRHATLPELDLIDMLRAHVVELVRQCFTHNVPRKESHRYIRLLIHKLAPFVEWKYTEGRRGRKDFWPDADRELKDIATEIQAIYGRRIGRTPRLTQQLDNVPSNVTVKVFQGQATAAEKRDRSAEMKATTNALRTQIKKGNITDQDGQAFMDELTQRAVLEGNRWHRFLSNGFYQPNSLREAVFHGDKHQRALSDILTASEVPVHTPLGSGKADIVVFLRRMLNDEPLWTPIMVLDIKTKTAMDWAPFSKRPRTEDKKARVLVTDISKRPLTKREWREVMRGALQKTNRQQLKYYSEGIRAELQSILSHPELIPKRLWQGIITLDTSQKYDEMTGMIEWLVRETIRDIRDTQQPAQGATLYQPIGTTGQTDVPKIALVVDKQRGPFKLLGDGSPLPELVLEDPFAQRKNNDRFFTLYLTVASPVSSGESAAYVARNWHLLQYLQKLTDSKEKPKVVWLDLFGEHPTINLALSRLRVTGALSPDGLDPRQMTQLRNLVRSFTFNDLSEEMTHFLEGAASDALEQLERVVRKAVDEQGDDLVIVVGGWPRVRDLLPPYRNHLLKVLERKILEWIPESNCEIIWLDRPVPLPTTSAVYQMHEAAPLPYDSPRRQELDVIIWNKPTRPRFTGWRAPMLEYLRVIEVDLPTSSGPSSELFVVPHLHGWGRRFRANTHDDRQLREEDVWELVEGPRYARGHGMTDSYEYSLHDDELTNGLLLEAQCLSPSLLRPRNARDKGGQEVLRTDLQHDGLNLRRTQLPKSTKKTTILDRVRLLPGDVPPRRNRWSDDPNRGYSLAKDITRAKVHREESELPVNPRRTVRPPLIGSTSAKIDTKETRLAETGRIKDACRVVFDIVDELDADYWMFMKRVMDRCSAALDAPEEHDFHAILKEVRDELSSRKESRGLWWALRNLRKETFVSGGLPLLVQEFLSEALKSQPDLWELYGNDIFILLLGLEWTGHDLQAVHVQTLWRAYAEWQYVHLGLKARAQPDPVMESVYDAEKLFSDMRERASQLTNILLPERVAQKHRAGLLMSTEGKKDWLVVQDEPGNEKMLIALTEDLEGEPLQRKFYDCIRNPVEFSSSWRGVDRIWSTQFFVLTRVQDNDILWTYHSDGIELGYWWAEGVFTYGEPPAEQLGPVRWFNLRTIPSELRDELREPEPVPDEDELMGYAEESMQSLLGMIEGVINVKCLVSIDEEEGCYVLELHKNINKSDSERGSPLKRITMKKTFDVIRQLRAPGLAGEPLAGEYWWDHRTDVVYDEVEVSTEMLSLSFLKPFVLRNRWWSEFLKQIPLPDTATDLLGTKLGPAISVVADPDLDGMKSARSRCWNILFLGDEQSNLMWSLSKVDLNIIEVAQFFEGMQFVDMSTGIRHPTRVVVNRLKDVNLPKGIFKYRRLAKWLQKRAYAAKGS